MDHDSFVAAFGQTVGVEKAEAADLGIRPMDSYSEHEVADICETIQRTSDGHIRLVASELRVRQQAQRRFDALLDEITDPVVTVRSDDGPSVTVRAGALGSGFYVADDGPGIPPDERERAFDHGYSTETDGTGFGLAIVEDIAEAHEWEVRVREGRDGGARFDVTGVTMG